MNICIVTVYNGENCGSYLQAYALMEKIKEFGGNVTFLERKELYIDHKLINLLRRSIKPIIMLNFRECILRVRKYFEFDKELKIFNITKDKNVDLSKIDCFVLGSDTIWDISSASKHFGRRYNIYWGLHFDINKSKVISYAASIGNTKKEALEKCGYATAALERMHNISVRDQYSKEVISALTKKNVNLVCDPTLFYSKSKYKEIEKACKYENFILIYCFEEFSEDSKKSIINFAKEKGLKLISYGRYRKWCDASIVYNPVEFLGFYDKADYIITNTFHGTIFSIIYKKQFISFAFGKIKVVDVLERLKLKQRIASESENFIEKLITDIDWKNTEKILENWVNVSTEYLKEAIKI